MGAHTRRHAAVSSHRRKSEPRGSDVPPAWLDAKASDTSHAPPFAHLSTTSAHQLPRHHVHVPTQHAHIRTSCLPSFIPSSMIARARSHARTLQRQTTDNFKDRGGRGGRDPDQCNLTMQATSSHHYNGHHISAPWVHHHVLVCVVYVGSTHTDLDLVSAEVP